MSTERPLRILLMSDEMEVGGSQRQIAMIAKGIDRRRFAPEVVYFRNDSFLVGEIIAAGVPVIKVEKSSRLDPIFLIKLLSLLRRKQYDVVHCFSFTAELWGSLAHMILGASRKTALITSVRGVYEWYTSWQWRVKRWCSGRSCRVVANSRAGSDCAKERMGPGAGRFEVIYNGVEMAMSLSESERHAVRSELGVEPDCVLGIFVGRFVQQKNLPLLLRALKRLEGRFSDFRVALAGDGPLRDQIARSIRELGLTGRVLVLGNRDDAKRLVGASDFLVMPSYWEGLSNSILEAMAVGCPVIASSVGGNVELVESGKTGMLFANDDDQALARCLEEMVTDKTMRERMGKMSRERAHRNFGIATMIFSVERLYEECSKERR